MDKPYISILVSVYNGEKTISRCLQSLVYQTLENIEIIVVDKESNDNTLSIVREYEKLFPTKVKVYERPYSINMAAGLTYGVTVASADYVTFCDADDWFELNAMEVLWNIIKKEAVDIVSFGWKFLKENGITIRNAHHPLEQTIKAQILSTEMCTYWSRLWKKNLLERHLPIPEVAGCDANFIPIVLQDAVNIRSIRNVLYNYMAGIGTSNKRVSTEWLTIIDGWNYLLEHSNKQYIDHIVTFIARRIPGAIKKYWLYSIEYVEWLKQHKNLFIQNPVLKKDRKLYQEILKLIKDKKEYIPLNVFINGFGKSKEEIQHKIDELNILPLSAGTGNVYILDETTISLENRTNLKRAILEGEYDYVGHFCALEKIEEQGGIFVGNNIIFRATFEPILQNKSFFSFITTNTFSDQIWGAQPHNTVIQKLLQTYQNETFYPEKYLPLSDRIRNVLVALYDVPLNGIAIRKSEFIVYDARMMVLNRMEGPFVCEHDMSHLWNHEHYTVIPDNLALPTVIGSLAEIRKLKQEVGCYKKELQDIYQSDSWKLIKKLKKFSTTTIGKPLKNVFKWLLRKYRKYKYGMQY